MRIYSRWDRKLGEIDGVVLAKNDEMIARGCRAAVKQDSGLIDHIEDYELVCLGSVNVESGVITPEVPIRVVCPFTAFLESANADA